MERIILLEMQLKEALDREQNLKKLNDQIMSAMNEFSKQDKGRDSHLLKKMHDQEIMKLKSNFHERVTILEYELRNKCQLYDQLYHDYTQLKDDWEAFQKKDKVCVKCIDLTNKVTQMQKQFDNQKDSWARESQEALCNLKSINEYESNVSKMKIKQLVYDLDNEKKEREKVIRTLQEQTQQHEHTQRSLLQQITDLHKAQNELIMQHNQYQLTQQYREQQQTIRETTLDQDKQAAEKTLHEIKEQMAKLEQHNKQLIQQGIDKEAKQVEQKNELLRKLNNERKNAEQYQSIALKLKEECQRKQSILLQDSLNKEQQIKSIQSQLTRQKSKNKYYETQLSYEPKCLKQKLQNQENSKQLTPQLTKHKKTPSQNDYVSHPAPTHSKNALSQGQVSKIRLWPSSIQKSEADSVNFNVNDMLNSTRNPGDMASNQSCRLLNEDAIGFQIQQFNYTSQTNQANPIRNQTPVIAPERTKDIIREQIIHTDRQLSPKSRSQQNMKVPLPTRIKTSQNEMQKENIVSRFK